MWKQKDNTTFREKVNIRKKALSFVDDTPIIMEAYGGNGFLFRECYLGYETGIVFEKDLNKVSVLAKQRPTWRVYQCDAEWAISNGIGSDLKINLLDIDAYGSPLNVINGFFNFDRQIADQLVIVVNDGLRIKVKAGGSWLVKDLKPIILKLQY